MLVPRFKALVFFPFPSWALTGWPFPWRHNQPSLKTVAPKGKEAATFNSRATLVVFFLTARLFPYLLPQVLLLEIRKGKEEPERRYDGWLPNKSSSSFYGGSLFFSFFCRRKGELLLIERLLDPFSWVCPSKKKRKEGTCRANPWKGKKTNDWLPILESHACYWEPIIILFLLLKGRLIRKSWKWKPPQEKKKTLDSSRKTGSHFLDSSFSTFGNQSGIQRERKNLSHRHRKEERNNKCLWEDIFLSRRTSSRDRWKEETSHRSQVLQQQPCHTFTFILLPRVWRCGT